MTNPFRPDSLKSRSMLHSLVGKNVLEFFPILCLLRPEIVTLKFSSFRREPGLNERLGRLQGKEFEERAARIASEAGIPFWNVALGMATKEKRTTNEFIDAVLRHVHAPDVEEHTIPAKDLSVQRILDVMRALPPTHGLGMSSRVKLRSGQVRHIPMLDFLCRKSPSNKQLIHTVVARLGQKEGIVVDSGRSYHFYGTSLMTAIAWRKFLGMSSLLAPITDVRYIGHRLIDNECFLRVADAGSKSIPKVVGVVV